MGSGIGSDPVIGIGLDRNSCISESKMVMSSTKLVGDATKFPLMLGVLG